MLYCAISFPHAKMDVTLQVQCSITQSGSQSCIGAENYHRAEDL